MHIGDKRSCGDLLRDLRLGAGLSSREAARVTGVGVSTILAAEKGYRYPSTVTLVLLLQFYGATVTIGAKPPAKDGTS